jgi:hypothetical protein
MFDVGDIISYLEMCSEEGVNLQRGMNYRLGNTYSVILMSVRPNAPYADKIENNGKTLIYEGHDIPNRRGGPDPKRVDQPMYNPSLCENDCAILFSVQLPVWKTTPMYWKAMSLNSYEVAMGVGRF